MMTSPALPESATFSYAAAASGRAPATSSKSPASKSGPSPPVPNGTPANGTVDSSTRTSTPRSVPSSGAEPRSTPSQESTAEATQKSSPSMPNSKEDYSETVTMSLPDEKSNAWEKGSQSSSHGDNRTFSSSGESTTETTKTNNHLVEATPPTVNVWKKRQEEMMARGKPTQSSASTTGTSSPPVAGSKSPNGVASSENEDSRQPETNLNGAVWKEKPQVKDDQNGETNADDESRDVAKNNVLAKDDGSSMQMRITKRVQSQEKEASPLIPPPPVTDAVSWPTPGSLGQNEIKKEKVDKEERPTQSGGRTKNWVTVPLDATMYTPAVQGKSSRGRGGRGAREGGRGGASQGGERSAGLGPGESTLESERGRSNFGPGGRGAYQAAKVSKRSTSPGGTIQRRESKSFADRGAGERRKDGKDGGEWYPDATISNKASVSTQTDRPRRGSRDPTRVPGEGQIGEAPDRYSANGYGYPARSSHTYNRMESDVQSSYPSRERGSERGRGGYRGRGGFHGGYQNGHHGSHYQGQMYNASTQYQNQSGQPFAQNRMYRGTTRSRPQFSNGNMYRFNPQMQPPPYSPTYTNLPYEFAAPPNPIMGTLLGQINYYFSVENLCKDLYLRRHMNSNGYVRLSFIAGFNRVKQHIGEDLALLRDACMQSDQLDLSVGGNEYFIRKRDGWDNWVMKEEDRDESARDDRIGNQQLIDPTATPYYNPMDPSYNQYIYPQQASTLSANVPDFSPYQYDNGPIPNGSVPSPAPTEFPDSRLADLIIVSKRPEGGPASPEASPNRAKSNGTEKRIGEMLEDTGLANGDCTTEESTSNHRPQKSQSDVGWIITNSPDSEKRLEEEAVNLNHVPYLQFHQKCMKKREASGPGKNPDMVSLYKFWSHFLVTNSNSTMYKEFKQFALEDADASTRIGVESLFRFYSALFVQKGETVRYQLVQDFVNLARTDARHGEALGVDRVKALLARQDLKKHVKHMIESSLDDEIKKVMHHGVGKKHEKSPAPDSYATLLVA